MPSKLTEQERREIAGRARTLHERLEGPANSRRNPPPIDPDRILNVWKERFPDEESFHARLAQDGLTEERVRDHVMRTDWPADEPLPDWIDTLEALIDHVETITPDERRTVPVPDETPFVELLAAIASFARQRLPAEVVPMDAVSPMVEWLGERLETVSIRPLYVEFRSFLDQHAPEQPHDERNSDAAPSTAGYDRFIAAVFDGGFRNLCREYPVLARHIVRHLECWHEAVVDVSTRLQSDRSTLEAQFDSEGPVTAFQPLTHDTHADGRVPIRVSFGSTDVIYKPRPVETGAAFYTILDRLSEQQSLPSFESPTYVLRDGYGWMEAIQYRDPADDAAIDRYYERAGALLCVAYVLNVTDLQSENLITAGGEPTVVDTETVFHPHVDPPNQQVKTAISAIFDQSVLRTALLPVDAGVWDDFDDIDGGLPETDLSGEYENQQPHPRERKAQAIAGFGSESGTVALSIRSKPVIEAVNTDAMAVRSEAVTRDLTTNTPTFRGDDRPPENYLNAIVRGFRDTYETITKLHADGRFLTEIVSPELIEGVENRLVYRPTHQYKRVQQLLTAREPLQDGIRSTIEMELLAASFFDDTVESDEYWPLYAAERTALRQLDVPRITSHVTQQALFRNGTAVGVNADESGYERCQRRLETMGNADLRRQIGLIRQCYQDATTSTATPAPVDVTDDRLRQDAVDLFDDVLETAVEAGDDDIWPVLYPTQTKTLRVMPADRSLLHGTGGIALTAAALYRITGRERYRRVVAETLDPILAVDPTERASLDRGGLRGIGSDIYSASVVGELLDDDSYQQAAVESARVVSRSALETDSVGVAAGTAGTVLALLACYERTGVDAVLERAVMCGDRLLDERTTADGHRPRKPTHRMRSAAGFAQGTSGIAYAFARLAALTGKQRYAEAARTELSREPASSSATDNDSLVNSWSRGRSGIALSRIGIAEGLGDETLLDAADDMLSAVATTDLSPRDTVCCGNFGRVETLLVGSRRAGGDLEPATDLLGRCLARRDSENGIAQGKTGQSITSPSFFWGGSGIAYTLLRVRNPDELPCVLLIE